MEPCKLHPQQDSEVICWGLTCTHSHKYQVALGKFWCLRAVEKEKFVESKCEHVFLAVVIESNRRDTYKGIKSPDICKHVAAHCLDHLVPKDRARFGPGLMT